MRKSFLILLLLSFIASPEIIAQKENPYPQLLFPVFSRGIVKMKDGRKMTATMNYDVVEEEMLFDQNGVYMALDKPQEIDTVYLQNRKFIPEGNAFYQVVAEGHFSFFIQKKGKFTQPGTPTAYGMTSQTLGPTKVLTARSGNQVRSIELPENVTVSRSDVCWVRSADNKMMQFTSQKQFLKLFPDKSDALKQFIKKNNINLQSEEDLLKLGNYCNTLF